MAAHDGGGTDADNDPTMSDAARLAGFAGLLFSRASREDVSAYDAAMLERAAELARAAVERHHKGESIVAIEYQSGVEREDRPVTVITVVNDNMPFLFDSIMGEIGEGGVAPLLVTHPVIYVTHDAQGVRSIEGEADASDGSDRLSVIHVHVAAMSETEAQDLETRIGRVLTQVRAAVGDWKPMLARLEHTISDYRYMPVPLDRGAVTEAVAFLEWLRDDNFTFLGMRSYSFTGEGNSGTLERTDQRGLGILSDPNLLVLRGNTQTSVTTPEILEFLNGPEPLIVTKANARSLVHRRAYLDYVGVMALELFVSKDAQGHDYLLANEIAPRVHNSGHWSIEGAITSQFENHIRAVVGLPLGDTDNIHPAIMVNVLGQYPDIKDALAIDGAHYHSYHKEEREDRKIAHITLMPNDVADLDPALAKLVAVLPNKVGLDKTTELAANTKDANSEASAISEDKTQTTSAASETAATNSSPTVKETNHKVKK